MIMNGAQKAFIYEQVVELIISNYVYLLILYIHHTHRACLKTTYHYDATNFNVNVQAQLFVPRVSRLYSLYSLCPAGRPVVFSILSPTRPSRTHSLASSAASREGRLGGPGGLADTFGIDKSGC